MDQEKEIPSHSNLKRLKRIEKELEAQPIPNKIDELFQKYDLPDRYSGVCRAPFIGIHLNDERAWDFREDLKAAFERAATEEEIPMLQNYWQDQRELLELGDRYREAVRKASGKRPKPQIWEDLVDKFMRRHFHYLTNDYHESTRKIIYEEGKSQIMEGKLGPGFQELTGVKI